MYIVRQDEFLQEQKLLVDNLKQDIPQIQTAVQTDTSVDFDWLPDSEKLLQKVINGCFQLIVVTQCKVK